MACPNGAEVDPVFTLTTVALNLVGAGITAVEGLAAIIPWLLESPIIGSQTTTALCALNLDDPGDFNLSLITEAPLLNFIPSPTAQPGTVARWLWDKTAYFYFQKACRCIGTQVKPPPPIIITNPPGVDTSPNQPNNADQLTRIENNQQGSANGLLNLYHLGQASHSTVGDLWIRSAQNLIRYLDANSFPMSGEGRISIPAVDFGQGATTQDLLGAVVTLDQIPPTVARRGTTYQRLYGVGSIEWDVGDQLYGLQVIGQRDALHYDRQFILSPQHAQSWWMRWRLQPGVVARGWLIPRNADSPFYAGAVPYNQTYQQFGNWTMPPNWSDVPFYPRPPARTFSLPGGGVPP